MPVDQAIQNLRCFFADFIALCPISGIIEISGGFLALFQQRLAVFQAAFRIPAVLFDNIPERASAAGLIGKITVEAVFKLIEETRRLSHKGGFQFDFDACSSVFADQPLQGCHHFFIRSCIRCGKDTDPPTGKIENMGKYIPTEKFNAEENRNVIFGMDFDTKGVLWYCVSAINDGGEHHEFGLPAGLFRWDVSRGGKPEYMGIAGVPERAACTVSEVSVNKEDILYISSTNHMLDGPQVIGVDLKVFDTSKPETGGMVKDPYFLKNDPGYAKDRQQIKYYEDQAAANPTDVSYEPACLPALLWRALAPDHIEDSCVKALFWDGADLCGICGEKDTYAFRIRDGEIVMLKPLSELAGAEKFFFLAGSARPAFSKDSFPPLPFVPGGQYKAVASAAADLPGGRKLIGTEDGLLAILENGKVKGLGAPSANGPIHALSAVPGKARVYGVSGDPEDIPTLFMWDDETGLTSLGCMAHGQGDDIRKVFNLTCVTSLAVSPDGKYLAVGSDERLGTVVIYRLP